jgi:hypothetical protein
MENTWWVAEDKLHIVHKTENGTFKLYMQIPGITLDNCGSRHGVNQFLEMHPEFLIGNAVANRLDIRADVFTLTRNAIRFFCTG